jgi:hypothetical protein
MSEKKKRNSNECNVDLRWSPTQGIQHDHRHGQHGRYDRRGPTRTADSRTRSPRPSRHERCRLELGQKEVVGTLADAFHALPPIQSVCHEGGESNGENGERRTTNEATCGDLQCQERVRVHCEDGGAGT